MGGGRRIRDCRQGRSVEIALKKHARTTRVIDRIDIEIDGSGIPDLTSRPRGERCERLNPHFRQGGLDRACGVYALAMMLRLHGKNVEPKLGDALTRLLAEHVIAESSGKKKPNITKIVQGAPVGVLATNGTDLALWQALLGLVARAWILEAIPLDSEDAEAKRLTEEGLTLIRKELDLGNPLLVTVAWGTGDETDRHAVVAVGYEAPTDLSGITRLYLLDAACGPPTVCPWNSVLQRVEGKASVLFRWADVDRMAFKKLVRIEAVGALRKRPR